MIFQPLERAARRFARQLGLRNHSSAPVGREEGASWYDALYASSDLYHCTYPESLYYFLWSVIADRIRRQGIRRILEIGCGPGQLASFLLDQGVEQYVGLDFSPTAIALAAKNAPAGRFVVGDARSPAIHLEVEHDAVICTEVLEHIEDDLQVVSNFRSGKRCYCSVPNFPYESHVRHFRNAAEVKFRYGPFFGEWDVMTFKSPRSPVDEFFLFEGIRNDYHLGNA